MGAAQVYVTHLYPHSGWASVYVTIWYNSMVLVVRWIQFGDTLRAFQVLLAHFDLLICIKRPQTYNDGYKFEAIIQISKHETNAKVKWMGYDFSHSQWIWLS